MSGGMANSFTPFQKKKGRKKRMEEEAVKGERRIMKKKNKKERKRRRRRTKGLPCLTTQFKKKVDRRKEKNGVLFSDGGGYSKGTAGAIISVQHNTA